MSATEKLAQFVANTQFKDIPAPVIERAKELFIDAVGAALAGTEMPVTKKIRDYYLRKGEGRVGEATILGTPYSMHAEEAGLVNGTSLHATELEAVPRVGEQQPAFTAFAALAMGEKLDLSGREVLEAFVLGFEVHGRLSAHSHGIPARGGWGCVTGTLGSAASAARAMGFDADRVKMALGFAASQTSGLIEHVGTTAHFIEMGIGTAQGIRSALWVGEGLTAMRDVVESPKGFCAFYAGKGGYDLEGIVAGLGEGRFFITDPGASIKKYPCCMRAHCAIDSAFLLVKEHAIRLDDVAEVEVGENFYVSTLLKYPEPVSEDQSRYSMEHCIAAVLKDGVVDERTFGAGKIRDLAETRKKIKVVMHPEWAPERGASRTPVTIRLKNGKEVTNELDVPLDPTREEIVGRYKRHARMVLGEKEIEESARLMMELEEVRKIRAVTALVRTASR